MESANNICEIFVKEQVWVQDSAAYDETVTTGYKCECGARK